MASTRSLVLGDLLDFGISENVPDRISRHMDFRKSGFSEIQISGDLDFWKSGFSPLRKPSPD